MTADLDSRLDDFARAAGLSLSPREREQLVLLDRQLERWSPSVRLVGFRNEEERFSRYLAEALVAAERLPLAGRAIDIGSGGGSPALPMAVRRPELRWTLLEPRRKKAIFLETAVEAMGLSGVTVVRERMESFRPKRPVEAVTSRGLALKAGSVERVLGWMAPGGRWLLITGESVAQRLTRRLGRRGLRLSKETLAPASPAVLLLIETG